MHKSRKQEASIRVEIQPGHHDGNTDDKSHELWKWITVGISQWIVIERKMPACPNQSQDQTGSHKSVTRRKSGKSITAPADFFSDLNRECDDHGDYCPV